MSVLTFSLLGARLCEVYLFFISFFYNDFLCPGILAWENWKPCSYSTTSSSLRGAQKMTLLCFGSLVALDALPCLELYMKLVCACLHLSNPIIHVFSNYNLLIVHFLKQKFLYCLIRLAKIQEI